MMTGEGTVYPLLARLWRQGLAETSWQESSAGLPRRVCAAQGLRSLAVGSRGCLHRPSCQRVACRPADDERDAREHARTAVRTAAKWNAQPEPVPLPEMQRALDTRLSRSPGDVQARFALLAAEGRGPGGWSRPWVPEDRSAERRRE